MTFITKIWFSAQGPKKCVIIKSRIVIHLFTRKNMWHCVGLKPADLQWTIVSTGWVRIPPFGQVIGFIKMLMTKKDISYALHFLIDSELRQIYYKLCEYLNVIILLVRHRFYVKNNFSNAIRSYWTECTNTQIASKKNCLQECHLFTSSTYFSTPQPGMFWAACFWVLVLAISMVRGLTNRAPLSKVVMVRLVCFKQWWLLLLKIIEL